MGLMPQELELWYVLPALRREFARELTNTHEFSQRMAAELLGVTEAAISQYKSSKRAKNVKFGQNILDEIKKSSEKIVEKKSNFLIESQHMCELIKQDKTLCKIHRRYESMPRNCSICYSR